MSYLAQLLNYPYCMTHSFNRLIRVYSNTNWYVVYLGGIEIPTLYFMIREAAESIQGKMTSSQIVDYIAKKYPNTNREAVRTLVRAYTVNNPNRILGYPENHKTTDNPDRQSAFYDILFQPNTQVSEYELYNPSIHGQWVITRTTKTAKNKLGLEVRLMKGKTLNKGIRESSKIQSSE